MAFCGYLKQSTAVDILLGPFIDDTDGSSAETGLTLDVEVSKNGQALANKNDATTPTHDGAGTVDGYYNCELDATDTNTLGILSVVAHASGFLPVHQTYQVVIAHWYDTMCSTDNLQVDVVQISGDSTAADNAESFFDGTGYAGTNNVIPTVTTLTGHTAQTGDNYARIGAPAGASVSADIAAIEAQTDDIGVAGAGLTGIPWNSAWDAEVESEVDDALGAAGADLTAIPWNAAWDTEVQSEVQDAIEANNLDHLVGTASGIPAIVAGTYIDQIMDDGTATYDRTTDSLQAIRDRGDAAWITGGGGGITDILNITPLIPWSIDLANTTTVRLGIMLINSLDDLPSTAEITPGTIDIDRKAIGGTSWSSIVSGAACSEIAGLIYYDEVFDTGTGYAEGDTIRITFYSQSITVSANPYEIIGATGRMFYTEIRQTMRGTDSAYTGTPPTAAAITDAVWDEAASGHVGAGTMGAQLGTDIDAILLDTAELQTDDIPTLIAALPAAAAIADQVWEEAIADHSGTGGSTAEALAGATAPSAATVADAVWNEALADHDTEDSVGNVLNDLTEESGGTYRFTSSALGQAPTGGAGSGAISFTYTLTSSVDASAIVGADVWVTSDEAGNNVLASGQTDSNGQVTFQLDAGTVYVWRQKPGWNFTNPDTETVA